jgi:hypothetical protein
MHSRENSFGEDNELLEDATRMLGYTKPTQPTSPYAYEPFRMVDETTVFCNSLLLLASFAKLPSLVRGLVIVKALISVIVSADCAISL